MQLMSVMTPPGPEPRPQNAGLVHTLDHLAARQQEMILLNAQLEETNRGVLAVCIASHRHPFTAAGRSIAAQAP